MSIDFLKKILKKPKIVIPSAIIILIAGSYFYFSGPEAPQYEFITAKKGDLVQKVSVTGRVKSAEDVDLAFEKGGKLANAYVQVGDKVKIGQKLASLDNGDVVAQLSQAQAGVETARASLLQYQATLEREQVKLDEMRLGARQEDLQVSQAQVASTKKALADTEINLFNVKAKADLDLANLYGSVKNIINDAYAKAEDAVNKQTDELFVNDLSDTPQLSFITSDAQAQTDAESKRVAANDELKNIKSTLDSFPTDYSGLDSALSRTQNSLSVIRDFLIRTNDALNSAVNLTQANITTYKSNLSTARTNINTAITNITSQQQSISSQRTTNQNNIDTAQSQVNSAKNSLAVAQAELDLKKAGYTSQQISAQEAQVRQAEANVASGDAQIRQAQASVQNYQALLSKTIISSPINGIVTKQDGKVGEIIAANNVIISVISDAKFEIEANIPEADIAKIELSDSAEVTLDTYGNDVIFKAQIVRIDPAETIIEGVATYKVTLYFIENDERIKSGMTANIDILTAERSDVINVPQRAVASKNNDKIVRILNVDDTVSEVKVKIGLVDSSGNIEIIEGINEGDKVIVFSK